ncbi:MAG: hypothetical protein K2L78_07860 [Muribaculaceae bacterium]|nr:hypothetical protein [Muribaculaceae bacterium]
MMKYLLRFAAVVAAASLAVSVAAKDKKEKNSDKVITAKVWFKDGSVYEGPLLKHWRTRRQTYLNPGHNFHTVPADGSDKSVKREAHETDSVLIISSTHDDFKAGDFYLAYNGEGLGALHKMLLRTERGRYADICRLPYWGNCTRGMSQLDQFMEYWYVCFNDRMDNVYLFYDRAIWKGCNKSKALVKMFCKTLEKDGKSDLAEAIMARFCPDKATTKESAKLIGENPKVLLDFIDNYIENGGK